MEVEARVSVQAMKGRFEQLHDESPQPATPSPTPKPSTSPLRLRSASVSGKVVSCSSKDGKHGDRFLDSREEVRKHFSGKSAKGIQSEEPHKNRSFLAGIVTPAFLGSRGLMKPSSSKKSLEKIGASDSSLAEKSSGEEHENVPVRRVSEGSALKKPSVVRRIPVFKSVDQGLDNKDGEGIGSANGNIGEHERKKIVGHLRSRSHGNFIVTREMGVEKNISDEEKSHSAIKNKENVWNKDVIVKTLRQKSSDNLFNNRDSKSDYSFEGKQKLVATVVKNMKNKDKPNVLRKLSFSSKIEKELQNKKEKAVTPNKKEKQAFLPVTSPEKVNRWRDHEQKPDKTFTSIKKIEIKARYPSDGKISPTVNLLTSDAVIQTAAIAKAVADIAATKAEMTRVEQKEPESAQSINIIVDPPTRPPRKRLGPTPRKKSRAPSPPGPPAESSQSQKYNLSEDEASSSHLYNEGRKSVDIHETRMLAEIQLNDSIGIKDPQLQSTDRHKSSDSLATSKASDRSRQNSPVMSSDGSPVWVKRKSLSSLIPSRGNSPVEGAHGATYKNEYEANMQCFKYDTTDSPTFKYEDVGMSPKDHSGGSTSEYRFEYPDKKDPECLPPGPPPKKPPRTFAYDIYKNSKISKNAMEITDNTDNMGENTKSSCEKINSSPEPVYAIPVKKKRTDKKNEMKPPIRSNSDLSKKDLVKPSVAPKPPHIVSKVKRASMVDPLSCPEKDEDAAMTSEFQRQAHIRYSLRRPKKPPPAPPHCSETEGSLTHGMGRSTDDDKANAHSQHNICSSNSVESPEEHRFNPHVRSCASSPNDLNHSTASDLEASPTTKFFPSGQSFDSNESDHISGPVLSLRQTSRSTYNLRTASPHEDDDQPTSLIHCPTADPTALSNLFRKRSMSDETLYKGSRHGEEPIYATPIFPNSKGSSGHSRQRELHYMCSVLFTDEEADGGRDGSRSRRNTSGADTDGNKGRASIISAWKREFRASCRHVQNKIKKSVIR